MTLRWYQREAIQAIYDYFARWTGNPILALPTGTGKSYVIAYFLFEIFKKWPGQRILCLTHVKELIAQNYKELVGDPNDRVNFPGLWPSAPAGIFSAGLGRKEVRPIVYAGIKSVVGKGALFGHIDIVLIDECHLVGPADDTAYESFLAELRAINPKVKVIGLTATPFRLGQGLLTEPTEVNGKVKPPLFTDIAYNICGVEPFNRLIAEGHLAPLVPKKTRTAIDVSGVKIIGGEFAQGQLQTAVDKEEITYACIQESIQLAADRKHWLVFGTGIRHCEHIASMLDACGISAVAVHSKTPDDARDKAVEDFKGGRIRALVNPVLYTVGFNHKPIDCILDLAPTSSASRHVQKYGRGTRPAVGKANCLVLDFAGNTKRNGPINDPVIPKRRRKRGEGVDEVERQAPVRLCPTCATWNHARASFCSECKGEFPPPSVKLEAEASTEEIIIGQAAINEIFLVNHVDYKKHSPHHTSGKPPSLKVNYHCGERVFTDWICLEHGGYASKKGRDWWRRAADDHVTEPPATIDEAIANLQTLQRPTHLKVWVNTKAPKILDYDYTGSAFGTQVPQLN